MKLLKCKKEIDFFHVGKEYEYTIESENYIFVLGENCSSTGIRFYINSKNNRFYNYTKYFESVEVSDRRRKLNSMMTEL